MSRLGAPLRGGYGRRTRERRYRRTLATGLILSVLAHAVVLIVSGRLPFDPLRGPIADETEPPRAPGLVIVGIDEVESPAPPEEVRAEPRRPEETEVIRLAPLPPEGGGEEEAAREEAAEEPEPSLTNAERLRPRYSDARIWIDPDELNLYGERLARYARADSAVRAILRSWLDSLALSEEERRRALDWTLKSGDERWGISPEGLHLGNITIPIPFSLAPSGPQRREFEQALRDLQEIRRQDLQADLEENRRERAEEMRRRSREEAERRRQAEEADSTFSALPRRVGIGDDRR